ncbi:MAG TPA: hydrogenase 3 maturation endopeptidase HyCI [Methanospirillum sp.]|nr:hydrogenase 3 maturation endopeptidase HyCI [Methanospirillum sp.]
MNLLLGVGNALLADDGIGCLVADRLHHPEWTAFIAGTVPENFTRKVREIQPVLLVIIDAAMMDLPPGSIRRVPLDRVADVGVGTHQLPLDAFCSIIASSCGSIMIIGIQPGIVGVGDEMSDAVLKAGDELLDLIQTGSLSSIREFGSEARICKNNKGER